MKATERNSKQSNRHHRYTRAKDARKSPIRGLWIRNGKFLARITVEDDSSKKAVKWGPLTAETVAEAQEAMCGLLVERSEDRLRHIGQTPKLADYVQTYGARRTEALRLRWSDVDFDRRQLAIGSDGTSKNRKPRHVDFSPDLEAHLRDMQSHRDPDST